MKASGKISSATIHDKVWAWVALLAAALLSASPSALALGIRIPNQDAEAIGRGNAFVATADNPSAIYYNPAGVTQLEGHHFQVGSLFYFGLISEFEANDGSGRSAETDYEVLPVPEFYYTYSPKESPFSMGLGVYSPFGLGLEWPEDTGFRSTAIEGRLTYLTINPVIAYQIHQTLSLAVGPTFNWSDTKLKNGIVNFQGLNDEFVFRGNDWDYGFNVGLRWQPHQQWSFGASYRSATSIDYDGYSKAEPAALFGGERSSSARIDFPQVVIAGVSYRPTPNWNIEINVDWADWNRVDTLTFENTAFGDVPVILDWHSSWLYEIGVTRYFGNRYFVSLGYFFCESSTSQTYYNPVMPDTDLHVASIGFGHKGEHWDWALAGQLITGPEWEVSHAVKPEVNGTYQWFSPTLSFSVGLHF